MRWMPMAMLLFAACATSSGQTVTLEKGLDGWRLLRDGAPYTIRGVGGATHLELAASLGANSIRTWGEGELDPRVWPDGRTMSLPDRAHELGLTVCAGFWVKHERHGFSYDDEAAAQRQLDKCVAWVEKWKDHPAILMWGLGNEVQLGGDARRSFVELEKIAKAVKAVDPERPLLTAIPGVWPAHGKLFNEHCPSIDILGVNAYGGLPAVPQQLLIQGYDGPYIVTEYGALGHWESAMTSWDAPVEQTSSAKAQSYELFHETGIRSQPDRALGGYAFLWGDKQECTGTWFGMLLPTGEKLAHTDVMSRLWTGRWPDNRAPGISRIESRLALRMVEPGRLVRASVTLDDPDGDPLRAVWEVRRESSDRKEGGDAEAVPELVEGAVQESVVRDRLGETIAVAEVRTPSEPGAYRLFVTVYDGQGSAATANTPFRVDG